MKSIRHRILFLTLLPFLTVYAALSVFIVYQLYRIQFEEIRLRLRYLALSNKMKLENCYENLSIAAQFCSIELGKIDPANPAAREAGEQVITARFRDPRVINTWLAFEPGAFDGRDAFHTNDYPGAPSGRYIRSFIRAGTSWRVLDDMDETVLGNMAKSYYYIIPMKTRRFFSSFGSHELLWRYGSKLVGSMDVTMPVFRNERVIGCVGLDAAINKEMLSSEIYQNLDSAIFLSDGTVAYSFNADNSGKTLAELGFENSGLMMDTMRKLESGYFNNVYSGITGEKSLMYIQPMEINNEYIYICASLPQTDIWREIVPVVLPVGVSFVSTLIVFSVLFFYLSRGIASPLRKLAEAGESILAGNLDMTINVVNSKDEMGMISRSLVRMAEQFRTGKLLQERYAERFDILLRIHYALYRSASLREAFNVMLGEAAAYFNISKGSLVFTGGGKPCIAALYPPVERTEGESEFFAHDQVTALIDGKKLFTMNGGALEAVKLPFLDFYTKSLCIVPLRVKGVLCGYIVMEGKNSETLIHDDTTLLFISDTLAYLVNSKAEWERETAEPVEHISRSLFFEPEKISGPELFLSEDDENFLEKARTIQNLDVDKGILLIGGEKKNYAELLRITIKVLSEEILKMRRLHSSDLPAFAIEVHGIKAALFNIGAEALGEEARQLEYAAKSDDAVYCRENYPALEEKLRIFSRNLAALFPRKERALQKGDTAALKKALFEARAACDIFDISAANAILAPFAFFDWGGGIIQRSLQSILNDMENLEYDGVSGKITGLIAAVQDSPQ